MIGLGDMMKGQRGCRKGAGGVTWLGSREGHVARDHIRIFG